MQTKFILTEKEMPTAWYNIQADLPVPLPPLVHPGTKEPTRLPPPLFPEALNEQEFSKERYIEIPEEILQVYRMWRPTPLFRAYRLEKASGAAPCPWAASSSAWNARSIWSRSATIRSPIAG